MGWFSRKKKNDRSANDADVTDADGRDDAVSDSTPTTARPASDGPSSSDDNARDAADASGTGASDAGAADSSGADSTGAGTDGTGEDAAAPAAPAAPSVSISTSSFQGLGASGPGSSPAKAPEPAPTEQLPAAPAAPPANAETVPGLRDNALVRDALAALPEKPTGAQVMGVVRQLMQGHLYLRVQGDARKTLSEGGQVTFGIAKAGDKDYMMVFSSGRALQHAVKADGDSATSAVAQPTPALIRHMLAGPFAGIIIDNYSQSDRVVVPREILQKAFDQADPELRLKNALAQPRDAETPAKLAAVLAQQPPLWVAVGEVKKDDAEAEQKAFGVAEARLADGTRLLQVFSHPLEVVALGRPEKAMPLSAEKIAQMLKQHEHLGGLLVDPAGPLMTLTREELAPFIALADAE